MRVIFFYPGEEGTYIDNAEVTLYENGIIHIKSHQEETTTHLQNCEILWQFASQPQDQRISKLRLLKGKEEGRFTGIASMTKADDSPETTSPDTNPEV